MGDDKCIAYTKAGIRCINKVKFSEPGSDKLTLCGIHYNSKFKKSSPPSTPVSKSTSKNKTYAYPSPSLPGLQDSPFGDVYLESSESGDLQDVPKQLEEDLSKLEINVQDPNSAGDDKKYTESLKDMLFGALKDNYTNHWQNSKHENLHVSSATRMRSLTNEMRFLKTNLPLHFNSTIALRFNESRPYMMTAIIFAPYNTPYDSGCFQFDICLKPDYPKKPPLVQLMTTASGRVRFSPNLYADGKVCLSLLGTWRGLDKSQEWNPNTGSIWQVLVSIQSAILGSQYPYFDEPGAEREIGTENGEINKRTGINGGYEFLREYTIKYAMTEQIKNPPKGFEDIVLSHFRIKKNYINSLCMQWLEEAACFPTSGKLDDYVLNNQSFDEAQGAVKKELKSTTHLQRLSHAIDKLMDVLNKL